MKETLKKPLNTTRNKKLQKKIRANPKSFVGKKVLIYDILSQKNMEGIIISWSSNFYEFKVKSTPAHGMETYWFQSLDFGQSIELLYEPLEIFKDMLK